jgi:hypothetical protein
MARAMNTPALIELDTAGSIKIGNRESTRYLRALAQCMDRCLILEP